MTCQGIPYLAAGLTFDLWLEFFYFSYLGMPWHVPSE